MAKSKAITEKPAKKKKKTETWSQSTKTGDMTKSINVEKLHNGGFLVTYEWYGEDKKGNWVSDNIKTYSEENPLDVDGETDALKNLFNSLSRN